MATLADIQASNAALVAAVAQEDTVVGAAVALITGLNTQVSTLTTQLAAAVASNDPVAIQTVVDSLNATTADIASKTQALAAAVPQNTPAPVAPPAA